MSIKISQALSAVFLQMTVLLHLILIGILFAPDMPNRMKQQEQHYYLSDRIAVEQTELKPAMAQFHGDSWLLVYRVHLADPWSCRAYSYLAFALLNDMPAVFMQVYLQMLGLKLTFQQLYFALQRYALVLMSRQPLVRFNLLQ